MLKRSFLSFIALFLVSFLAACGTSSDGPTVCGDGKIDPGEQCDDGNTINGDGCGATCTRETDADGGALCGNGKVDTGEECDDGNTTAADGCEANCKKSTATEVVCKVLPPVASGTCAVTAGSAAKLLSGTILTPGVIYRGGSVLVDAMGSIACVGCACDAMAQGATTISCPNGVISAALINTHDHITYAQNNPYTDSGERYESRQEWRKGLNGHSKITTPGSATPDQVRWAELRFLLGGATSTVGSGSVAGLVRNLDKAPDEIGLNQTAVDFDTFPLGDSSGTLLTSGCAYGSVGSIRTPASIAADDAFLPHVAEGISSAAQNEYICLSSTANGGQDVVQAKTSLIHSVGLTATDYADIGKRGGAIIWSPRSNITLYGDTAIVTEAARLGARIALGTDWVATGSMNLLRELRCADSVNKTYFSSFFSDEQLWRMVTLDAARATATDDVIGVLANGKVADISIFNGATHKDFRAVIDADPADVVLVMRGGKVLYGDANVVTTAPGSGTCDALDVCGTAKQVCLQDEFGKNLAGLTTAVGTIYPAFFCTTPQNEPSCVPSRPASVNGSTIYTGVPSADDTDGDGIANAMDNCPTIFNPVRPMDNGHQANIDGDANGDACDVCPLEANTTTCKTFNADDSDGDGVPNAMDNCPLVANANQLDTDGDMKGDACDACPTVANPGAQVCEVTIYDIKTGVATVGSAVSLVNRLVTARTASGFYLQMKVGDPGYVGSDNSGVFVFQSANTVAVGDRVTLTTATVANHLGQIQLTAATAATTVVTSLAEAAPDAVVVAAADVATGGSKAAALESVLVQINAARVTDIAPALGTGDTPPINEFVVNGSLRINDALYLTSPFPVANTLYTSLAGVLDFRNGDSKLEPRSVGDVVLGAPQITSFNEASSFTRVGASSATTIPTALAVRLTSAALADTFVPVTSSDSALTVVSGGVTVLAGQTSAPVLVNGVTQSASVTLTATLNAIPETATVRVVDVSEQPTIVSITPPSPSVQVSGTLMLTVNLDIPSPVSVTVVALALSPANAGTVPSTVTVPADQISATFSYVDGGLVSGATITATFSASMQSTTIQVQAGSSGLMINEVDYDNPLTDTAEFVEIFNNTGSPIVLTGYALVLVNGSNSTVYKTIDLGPAGTLASQQYLVVGSTTAVTATAAGQKTIDLGALMDILQNGSPDGLALVNTNTNTLVDAFSYEGAITAATITGLGAVSLVEGTVLSSSVADSNATSGSLCRLPNATDTNNAATDWAFSTTPTPGAANTP